MSKDIKSRGDIYDRLTFAASHKDWGKFSHCWGDDKISPTDVDMAVEIEGFTLIIEHKSRDEDGKWQRVESGQFRAFRTWAHIPGWKFTVLVVWADHKEILLGHCPWASCERPLVHAKGIGDARQWKLINTGMRAKITNERQLEGFCTAWQEWARSGGQIRRSGCPFWNF